MRGAPEQQQKELWRQISEQVEMIFQQYDQSTPLWLCTDGRGVPWLHVRLDSTPKYVKHTPYTGWSQHTHDHDARNAHVPHPRGANLPANWHANRNNRNPKPRKNEHLRRKSSLRQVNEHYGRRDEAEACIWMLMK